MGAFPSLIKGVGERIDMVLWSQDKYIKALKFAAEAHRGQLFPGTDLLSLPKWERRCRDF